MRRLWSERSSATGNSQIRMGKPNHSSWIARARGGIMGPRIEHATAADGGFALNQIQKFLQMTGDLRRDPKVRAMGRIAHHTERISCLNHCLFVSYVGYRLSRFLGGDARAIAKGGLLHDLYLCDWKKERSLYRHLLVHPEMAVRNAQSFHLTALEAGIIRKHMWPVTFFAFPTRREEFIVNLADKICAVAEVTGLYWHLNCCKSLAALGE